MNANNGFKLEVCVDNIQSGINAADGGASRIELCSALSEGGLTPSLGTFTVLKRLINIPIFVMLRPHRGWDFVYSEAEIEALKHDAVEFKNAGADGFVFGVLREDSSIDETACSEILEIIRPQPATFHRAFDCVGKPLEALRTLIDLGFRRVLTSGQKKSAVEGSELIRKLVDEAKNEIVVMPGGGVNAANIRKLMVETGANEVHGSFKTDCDECDKLQLTNGRLVSEAIKSVALIDSCEIREK